MEQDAPRPFFGSMIPVSGTIAINEGTLTPTAPVAMIVTDQLAVTSARTAIPTLENRELEFEVESLSHFETSTLARRTCRAGSPDPLCCHGSCFRGEPALARWRRIQQEESAVDECFSTKGKVGGKKISLVVRDVRQRGLRTRTQAASLRPSIVR